MSKLINSWEELKGLESENYKIVLEKTGHCGWIVPKVETEETQTNYFSGHIYLSTHTFYTDRTAKRYSEILQEYGFDVELVSWELH